MNFYEKIRAIQRKNNSLLCIGLDTDVSRIPASLASHEDPILEFNRRIIDSTKDVVCAYKLNMAFYETAGAHCWNIVHQTLASIPEGIITIGDAKRGDIGNSAEMYARSIVEDYKFTSCTVSPYMGGDSVKPFMRNAEQGVFVLVVTSNPGARDLQYLKVRERPLYEHVVGLVKKWNSNNNCGLVVGATRPAELRRVRALAPEMPLLIPGIGAQGGEVKSVVRSGCDKQGEMAIINASRSVIYASAGEDFAEAARSAAIYLRDEINKNREELL